MPVASPYPFSEFVGHATDRASQFSLNDRKWAWLLKFSHVLRARYSQNLPRANPTSVTGYLVDLHFSLMVTPPTTHWNWFKQLQRGMWSFSVSLLILQLIASPLICLSLVLWSCTGHKSVVSTCSAILGVLWPNFSVQTSLIERNEHWQHMCTLQEDWCSSLQYWDNLEELL